MQLQLLGVPWRARREARDDCIALTRLTSPLSAEFGTQIADIFQSLSGIQNQTSSLMASAGTDYTSTMNSWLSALKPQTQGVTANLDWSSIAKSFTSGDLVSKLTKLGAASVATKVLVESGWWKDISESLDQADGLFDSLPVAGKVAECRWTRGRIECV